VHRGRVVFGAMDEVVFGAPPPRRWSGRWTVWVRSARF